MRGDEFPALAEKHGLGDRLETLVRAARTGIVLEPDEGGESRLGGAPSLAGGAEWPAWRGRPMSLLAEIRVDEVITLDDEDVLPASGALLFFYDSAVVLARLRSCCLMKRSTCS